MRKSGLKIKDVSPDHYSSGIKVEPTFSRFVVKVCEGRDLLASDRETGKSDPVCFVWLGLKNEGQPDWSHINEENAGESRVLMTSLQPTTINPVWNEELTFPIDISGGDVVGYFENLRCVIYIRDEDRDAHDVVSYDELGMIEFPVDEFLATGKGCQSSIVKSGVWYPLKKSPGMRRVEGALKLTVSVIFSSLDLPAVMEQVAPPSISTKTAALNTSQNCGLFLQQKLKTKKFENASVMSKANNSITSSLNDDRPSSASSYRSRKRGNRPSTAPMLKSDTLGRSNDFPFIGGIPEEISGVDSTSNLIKSKDDDLVSLPSFNGLISQIKGGGRISAFKPDIIPEEENEEELDYFPGVDELELQGPVGDEGMMEDFAENAGRNFQNAISNAHISDKLQKGMKAAGQAAAKAGTKALAAGKMVASDIAAASAPGVRQMKDSIVSEFDKMSHGVNNLLDGQSKAGVTMLNNLLDGKSKTGLSMSSAANPTVSFMNSASSGHAKHLTINHHPSSELPLINSTASEVKSSALNGSQGSEKVGPINGGSSVVRPVVNAEKEELIENFDAGELKLEGPAGDQNIMQEVTKVLADQVFNAVSNVDISDTLQENFKVIGKSAVEAGKNVLGKGKIKVAGVSSASGPGVRNMKESILSGLEKMNDRFGNLASGNEKTKRNSKNPSDSMGNIFADGPRGDFMENPGIGENSVKIHRRSFIISLDDTFTNGNTFDPSGQLVPVSQEDMILHSVVSSGVENLRNFINSDSFDRDASLLVGNLLDIGQKMATRFPKLAENPLFTYFVQLNGNVDLRNPSVSPLLTQMAVHQLKAVVNSETFPDNAAFFVQCVIDAGTKMAAENPQVSFGSGSFFPLPVGDRSDNIPGITFLPVLSERDYFFV
jgi:hypothetical protein